MYFECCEFEFVLAWDHLIGRTNTNATGKKGKASSQFAGSPVQPILHLFDLILSTVNLNLV